jgi:hypothetical protein
MKHTLNNQKKGWNTYKRAIISQGFEDRNVANDKIE